VGWYPVSDLELRRSSNPLCCPQTRAIGVYADRARVKMRGQAVLQGGRSVPCHYLDVGGPGFDPSSSLQDSISPLHSQPPTRRSIRPTWSLSQALANPSQRRISIPSQLYNVTFSERVARPRLWRRAHLKLSASVTPLCTQTSSQNTSHPQMQAIDAVVWTAGQTTSNVPRNVPSRFAENLVRHGSRNIFSPLHPVCPLMLGPTSDPVAASF
jgi:hypothetical protein